MLVSQSYNSTTLEGILGLQKSIERPKPDNMKSTKVLNPPCRY